MITLIFRKSLNTIGVNLKRYYVGRLTIEAKKLFLSLKTRPELPEDLRSIKKRVGLPLVKFDEANVELESFVKDHLFNTRKLLREAVLLHFREVRSILRFGWFENCTF